MEPYEQIPFGGAEFAENPEPRCPCLLLLDTSSSMGGRPIQELNAGLVAFKDELAADSLAAKRAEICVVTFGPPSIAVDFQTADTFSPPTLTANADTPMGAAISLGLDLIDQRKEIYRSAGVAYYRPWVFMITDGAPTDDWSAAAARVREGQLNNEFTFHAVGVEGANMDILSKISSHEPLKLDGLRFRDLFVWLSKSMRGRSHSQVGDAVPMDNPAAPGGWATI